MKVEERYSLQSEQHVVGDASVEQNARTFFSLWNEFSR